MQVKSILYMEFNIVEAYLKKYYISYMDLFILI